ncbi:uncharacterized protein KIAA1143 homolog [Xenia sp. Carnegie-2017]|uniref:uncharacterized protein KIAA1143 homolog n=1 Tax=Xenia sp. Carnegie-2017 TaxID=2897299 RepID=UPI001F0494B4|nr:uncharacterized protein KIAA1143 homolog [Xenia sp. Carnegie-2017]
MSARRNVKYVDQEEPSFLKKFKERVGYKEPADIKDKYAEDKPTAVEESEENEREKEDEQPVVVQLKSGDLSAEEAAKLKQESNNEGDCWDSKTDKPKFKKPEKRSSCEKDAGKDKKKKKIEVKAVKNSKLLSFDEDDEEND